MFDAILKFVQELVTTAEPLTKIATAIGGVATVLGFVLNRKKNSHESAVKNLQAALFDNLQISRELTTVRKDIPLTAEIVDCKGKKFVPDIKILDNLRTRKYTVNYMAKIVCGCDVQQIRYEKSGIFSGGVKVRLPHCRIFDAYVDLESIVVTKKEIGSLAAEFKPEELITCIKQDFETKKQSEIDKGILTLADEEVKKILVRITEEKNIPAEILFLTGNSDTPKLNPANN